MAEINVKINGSASGFNSAVNQANAQLDALIKKAGSINIGGASNGNGINGAKRALKELGEEAAKTGTRITNVVEATTDGSLVAKTKEVTTNVQRTVTETGETIVTVTKHIKSSTDQLRESNQKKLDEAAKGLEKEAKAQQKLEEAAKRAAEQAEASAKQWRNWYSTMLAMRALSAVFNSVKKSVSEALDEIKKVDSALVVVRKVSNASQEEISKIEKAAYETAAKYGMSTSEFLDSVATFTRAGYKESASGLAELSTKAQLVGDMTATTANQMLLAVDAAYKYQGSLEDLGAVLDGMNEIDNNFATSIEKIAAGLGKVAPIANQVNMGVDELSAALGTITAVTQRSGEEAATALRALMLNIVGNTTTEIEDGATWTAGEIKGMRDVMMKYIPDIVKESERLGEVLNPMEVIGAFAKAYQEGTMNANELFNELSDIGGKLRTSQLLALVQNWDMYESMLKSFNNSVGSADKEVENALDSWEVKAQRLETTWTKVVAGLTDTGAIKGTVDLFTGILDVIDGAPAKLIALSVAIAGVVAAIKGFESFKTAGNVMDVFKGIFAGGTVGKILAVGAALATVAVAIKAISDANSAEAKSKVATDAYEEWKAQEEAVKSVTDELESQKARIKELTNLGGKRTEAENAELTALKAQTKELEAQLVALKKVEAQKKKEAMVSAMDALKAYGVLPSYDSSFASGGTTKYGENWYWDVLRTKNNIYDMLIAIEDAESAIASLSEAGFESGKGSLGTWEAYLDEMESAIVPSIENIITLRKQLSEGIDGFAWGEMSNEQKNAYLLVAQLDEIIKAYTGISDVAQEVADVSESGTEPATQALEDVYGEASKLEEKLNDVKTAFDSIGEGAEKGEAFDTLKKKFNEAFDMAEAGKYGSTKLKELLETVFPGVIEQCGGDLKKASDSVFKNDLIKALFGEGDAYSKLELLYKNLDKLNGVSISKGENGIDMSVESLDDFASSLGISKDALVSFLDALDLYNTSGSGFTDDVSLLNESIASVEGTKETDFKNNAGEAKSAVDGYINSLNAIPLQKVTVLKTVNTARGFASGTTNAPGGTALVNERGAELISDNGRAYIANGGQPTLVNLSPGAVVLNAEQTRGVLAGKGASGINAYALGTGSVYSISVGATTSTSSSATSKKSKSSKSSKSSASSTEDSVSLGDYFSAVEKYYSYVLTWSDRYIDRIAYQLELLQNDWDDLKEPIDEQISALEKINEKLSRQVTMLERERDALTEPLNKQIEAMKAAKEISDEEEQLEEKRLAVEEARANLQSANQERTIRYWNKEKGQWEWIADQSKVNDASKSLAEAEQALADYEYEMQITALERQVSAIESQYQEQMDELDKQQQTNDDLIYDLQSQLSALEEKYTALMQPLEKQQTELERQASAWEQLWRDIELSNTLYPEYDGTMSLKEAIKGTPFEHEEIQALLSAMGEALGVTWLKFDKGGVANGKGLMAKGTDSPEIVLPPDVTGAILDPSFTPQTNRLLAGLGIMFGASGASSSGRFTTVAGNTSTDNSNTYIVNGLTLGSDAGSMKVKDMFDSLAIYASR